MRKTQIAAWVLLGGFGLVCASSGAALAHRLSAPLMAFLGRMSARSPFPIAAVFLPVATLLLLLKKSRRAAALTLTSLAFLTWLPALCAGAPLPPETASEEERAALCRILIAELTNEGKASGGWEDARVSAQAAMNCPCPVKASRLPGWMRSLRLSGLYFPLTGEALVDATRPPASLPFTAAHELAHAGGIASEYAANCAAYDACVRFGGLPAYSARLWALKYAMAGLSQTAWVYGALPEEIADDLRGIPYARSVGGSYEYLADELCVRMRERLR